MCDKERPVRASDVDTEKEQSRLALSRSRLKLLQGFSLDLVWSLFAESLGADEEQNWG